MIAFNAVEYTKTIELMVRSTFQINFNLSLRDWQHLTPTFKTDTQFWVICVSFHEKVTGWWLGWWPWVWCRWPGKRPTGPIITNHGSNLSPKFLCILHCHSEYSWFVHGIDPGTSPSLSSHALCSRHTGRHVIQVLLL